MFVVFRSGRSGHKTSTSWTPRTARLAASTASPRGHGPTSCVLVPDAERIAFVSDRHNPGGGSFAIYMIQLNGTGLRRGDGGCANLYFKIKTE